MSDTSRAAAVLFAKDMDRVATFYSAVLGLVEANRDDDHIVLESPGFQLVVHRIVGGAHAADDPGTPPARRATAAFKPVFFVPSLSRLRTVTATYGGVLEPVSQELSFNGVAVCDGIDPEGNVIQFRELATRPG